VTRLDADDAELYDIAFEWDIEAEADEMTAWTPETWRRAIAGSSFEQAAAYDGGRTGEWPRVGAEATGGLLWHELGRSG
jgi:hypothetical protein